jgi:hypothetical protein
VSRSYIPGFNGFYFLFFSQAAFDLVKEHKPFPDGACVSIDRDQYPYETFFFEDVRYIKYGRYCRYLFDIDMVSNFLVSEHVVPDPRRK